MIGSFIWHLRGSVSLDGSRSNQELIDRIEHLLERQKKTAVERGEDYVIFDEPIANNFWGSHWEAMAIYIKGRIWIEQDAASRVLCYDLSSIRAFLFCLSFPVMAFIVFAFISDIAISLHDSKYAALMSGFLYGMHLMLSLARVPRAIRRAVGQTKRFF